MQNDCNSWSLCIKNSISNDPISVILWLKVGEGFKYPLNSQDKSTKDDKTTKNHKFQFKKFQNVTKLAINLEFVPLAGDLAELSKNFYGMGWF